ncbi:MAG: P27 family phage terminase small subunit [Planctomycetota bacterium]
MAKRGPKPKPASELSSRRQREKARAQQAMAPTQIPRRPPPWLHPAAVPVWKQMLEELGARLTAENYNPLVRYCETWVRHRAMLKIVDAEGEIVAQEGSMGQPVLKRHPAALAADSYARQLASLEKELLLTPATRPQPTDGPQTQDEFEKQFFADDERTAAV